MDGSLQMNKCQVIERIVYLANAHVYFDLRSVFNLYKNLKYARMKA